MKFSIAFSFIIILGRAASVDDVELLSYKNDIDINGYEFSYELSDGTKREEKGILKNIENVNKALSVEGSYSWTSPDGETWIIIYTADENGFRPLINPIKNKIPEAPPALGISGPLVASLLG